MYVGMPAPALPIDAPVPPLLDAASSHGSESPRDKSELRAAFDDFVGQTFYSQLLAGMRKTVGKPAYFHGGRAEEVFQSQLDQVLAEEMSQASASQITDPMFALFTLPRP